MLLLLPPSLPRTPTATTLGNDDDTARKPRRPRCTASAVYCIAGVFETVSAAAAGVVAVVRASLDSSEARRQQCCEGSSIARDTIIVSRCLCYCSAQRSRAPLLLHLAASTSTSTRYTASLSEPRRTLLIILPTTFRAQVGEPVRTILHHTTQQPVFCGSAIHQSF